jgi:hypothetical protein
MSDNKISQTSEDIISLDFSNMNDTQGDLFTITAGTGDYSTDTISISAINSINLGQYSISAIGGGGSGGSAGAISGTGGTGGGYIFTSPNTTTPTYQWNTSGTGPTITMPNLNGNLSWDTSTPTLHVKGDAEFESDIKIKGKSIMEMFDKIEERLGILHPNPKLEEKWEELRELAKRYKELEQDIIEKEKIWAILKK